MTRRGKVLTIAAIVLILVGLAIVHGYWSLTPIP